MDFQKKLKIFVELFCFNVSLRKNKGCLRGYSNSNKKRLRN